MRTRRWTASVSGYEAAFTLPFKRGHMQFMKTRKEFSYRKARLVKAIPLEERILTIRGQKVILDADLAQIYGVTTKALNQAVKRNREKFPEDFMFALSAEEAQERRSLTQKFSTSSVAPNRSQIVTGSQKHRDPRS